VLARMGSLPYEPVDRASRARDAGSLT